MKKIRTKDAVGMVLCHDLTKIVPGEFKGAAFRKGQVIRPEDINELLKIGKEYLYVWEYKKGFLHEDDAAERLSAVYAGEGVRLSRPKEGKINLIADRRGLLKINIDILLRINEIEDIVLATRHTNQLVQEEDVIAGARVIPLVVDEDKIRQVEDICQNHAPVIEVKPILSLRTGIITTGNEVFHGRIVDRFGPVVKYKLETMGCPVIRHVLVPDDSSVIKDNINELVDAGIELIIVTGGMSVDPDDATPGGIRATGAHIVTYGAPLFPGAMFLLSYIGDIPVLGLPGCVMYHKTTIFDIVLPRLLAGERLSRKDLTQLGHGGLCLNCPDCRYPDCSFGKGS